MEDDEIPSNDVRIAALEMAFKALIAALSLDPQMRAGLLAADAKTDELTITELPDGATSDRREVLQALVQRVRFLLRPPPRRPAADDPPQ